MAMPQRIIFLALKRRFTAIRAKCHKHLATGVEPRTFKLFKRWLTLSTYSLLSLIRNEEAAQKIWTRLLMRNYCLQIENGWNNCAEWTENPQISNTLHVLDTLFSLPHKSHT
jgi:hypothetical protein